MSEKLINTINKLNKVPRRIRTLVLLKWNKVKFTLLGIEYGNNLKIINRVKILLEKKSKVIIGNNFALMSGDYYNPLYRNIYGIISAMQNAKIKIGDNVGMSSPCISAHKSITIGNNVKIGANTTILDSDCHSLNYKHRRIGGGDTYNKVDKEIVIGDDVLIGMNCLILKGVCIGARSIIGAGSVVSKNIPEDCIAAGNPCRIIKKLTN
jgi:acetyltransferase-like isoleucine patch superfamily enzyme